MEIRATSAASPGAKLWTFLTNSSQDGQTALREGENVLNLSEGSIDGSIQQFFVKGAYTRHSRHKSRAYFVPSKFLRAK